MKDSEGNEIILDWYREVIEPIQKQQIKNKQMKEQKKPIKLTNIKTANEDEREQQIKPNKIKTISKPSCFSYLFRDVDVLLSKDISSEEELDGINGHNNSFFK